MVCVEPTTADESKAQRDQRLQSMFEDWLNKMRSRTLKSLAKYDGSVKTLFTTISEGIQKDSFTGANAQQFITELAKDKSEYDEGISEVNSMIKLIDTAKEHFEQTPKFERDKNSVVAALRELAAKTSLRFSTATEELKEYIEKMATTSEEGNKENEGPVEVVKSESVKPKSTPLAPTNTNTLSQLPTAPLAAKTKVNSTRTTEVQVTQKDAVPPAAAEPSISKPEPSQLVARPQSDEEKARIALIRSNLSILLDKVEELAVAEGQKLKKCPNPLGRSRKC